MFIMNKLIERFIIENNLFITTRLKMSKPINYPTPEKIIEFNILVLSIIKVKKADKPEVMSHSKLIKIIESCKEFKGDIYDKAAELMIGLIGNHPFASGNRRTAFIAVKDFLLSNNQKLKITDDPKYAKVMTGIREGYYTHDEVKEWIKNGKIKEFK